MNHFAVFGGHPRLSLAEFKALLPHAKRPRTIGATALISSPDWNGGNLMQKSGGIVKLGDILTTIPIDECDVYTLADLMDWDASKGELNFGCTVYGSSGSKKKLEKLPVPLKKELKARGYKSRWVTTRGGAPLTPAAVAKLKLTTNGYDLVLLVDEGQVHVGRTTHVQDADAWSLRDYGRPERSAATGMLPPKLARIMVNIGIGMLKKMPATVLDPFCGNGTVLMETLIVNPNIHVIGSDIKKKQTASSKTNIEWCIQKSIIQSKNQAQFLTSDVRALADSIASNSIDLVVTEGHLGPPLNGGESQETLDQNVREIESLWKDALAALHPLLKSDAIIVGIWPSYKTKNGMARVGLDRDGERLGYTLENPLVSWDDTNDPLIYMRQGQHIARRIVILKRIASVDNMPKNE